MSLKLEETIRTTITFSDGKEPHLIIRVDQPLEIVESIISLVRASIRSQIGRNTYFGVIGSPKTEKLSTGELIDMFRREINALQALGMAKSNARFMLCELVKGTNE
jgi:hypothetical protein